jgi:hypothetical protein
MSKGLGKTQRTIRDLLLAQPDKAWPVEDIAAEVYGVDGVEKKHLTAVGRALNGLAGAGLLPDLGAYKVEHSNRLVFFNQANRKGRAAARLIECNATSDDGMVSAMAMAHGIKWTRWYLEDRGRAEELDALNAELDASAKRVEGYIEVDQAEALAAAIALVEAAGLTVIRPGHNGGPDLEAVTIAAE